MSDKPKYTELNLRPYEIHAMAAAAIRPSTHVLDLGCATGAFAKSLASKDCFVVGVEADKRSAEVARKHIGRVIVADLEKPAALPFGNGSFDHIVLLDVIEHLRDPSGLLAQAARWLAADGTLVLSTPNIAHISIRWSLASGRFDYTDYGILDRTHVHFYTRKNLRILLDRAGFDVVSVAPSADFGQLPVIGRFARRIPKRFQAYITGLWPTVIGVQFLVVARPRRLRG